MAQMDCRGTGRAALAVGCEAFLRASMEQDAPGPSRVDAANDRAEACARIRRHLESGAPWDACDAFREDVAKFAGDADFLYWGALAHARAGATREAHPLLDRAQATAHEPALVVEILSLRGRLWKDSFQRVADDSDAVQM